MPSDTNLHNRLKKLRIQNGYTQKDIAQKLNISRQAVSNWENGLAYPDIDNLTILSKIYGISVDGLLNETPNPTGQKTSAFSREDLWIVLILLISMFIGIIDLIVSVFIFIWLLRRRKEAKALIFFSAICIIYSLYKVMFIVSMYIPQLSSGTIEQIL